MKKIFRTLKNRLKGRRIVADKELSLDEAVKVILTNAEFIDGKIFMKSSRIWKHSPGSKFVNNEKRDIIKTYLDDYMVVVNHLKERYEGKEELYQFQLQIFKNSIIEKHYISVNGKKTIVSVGEETVWYEPQDITIIEYITNKLKN